ncbi:hypothetical protein JCM19046_4443 [Bacillus sp. JCM 19046]|nr:hypothetical protein JCM19046_4443 [Bacillus sp. JCM 19046]
MNRQMPQRRGRGQRPQQQQHHPHQGGPQRFYPGVSPQQQAQPKKRSMWSAPFTNEQGKFDIGRSASSVDQFVKTMQQVTPFVSKVGRFFK